MTTTAVFARVGELVLVVLAGTLFVFAFVGRSRIQVRLLPAHRRAHQRAQSPLNRSICLYPPARLRQRVNHLATA